MRSLLPLLFLLACTLQAHALEPGTDVESPKADGTYLIVGTKSSPPIAFKGADGKWTGLAIEMWRKIALLKVLDTPEWESLWRQYIGP
ncbi:MAG: hypothetical protein VX727_00930 [Planctomycetota bacterium]|nr:hypothetical protein [Planctomycetota bacterium]